MGFWSKSDFNFRVRIAAFLGIAILLFATFAAAGHQDDPNSSAPCQLCYVSHLPLLNEQISPGLPAPIGLGRIAPAPNEMPGLDPVTRHTPSRAPPAA
jgi:hypothetical protein